MPEDWHHYFVAQKYKWRGEWNKSLEIIKKSLKKAEDNLTLFYLLQAELLYLSKLVKDESADKIFDELRKNFFKIPLLARRIIAPTLWSYSISNISYSGVSKVRLWSRDYVEDKTTYLFMLFNKANEENKRGNLSKAIKYYFQSIKIARDIPHPTGLIYSLNNSAWCLRDRHPLFALKLAEGALYYLGYFRENIESGFFVVDTLFHIQRKLKREDVFNMRDMVVTLYGKLPEGKGWGTKEHYKTLKEFFDVRKINLNIDVYENTDEVRNYLKKLFQGKNLSTLSEELKITKTNLSNLLRGRTLKIKGNTIRKIMEKYRENIDLFEAPFPIVNEFFKEKIRKEYFGKNRDKFIKLSTGERIIGVVSTYMSLINRDYFKRDNDIGSLVKIMERDFEGFLRIVDEDLYLMEFLNRIFRVDPIIEARKCLVLKFINVISEKRRVDFIKRYLELEEKDRNLIDVFVRNYVRYNLKWEMEPESNYFPEKFLKYYQLKKTPLILSIYYLDNKLQRKRLINLLDQMVL
ncbi:hypothetical protein [Dictyoglomus thermophilum]|uniref:hypothetical protein n=1 Tax=Dictyoglomus thermophilum TaxID=14 RepID=UPI001F439BDE|nr:hypothetical protein [Dictyoglomus thermophilum]